MLRCDYNVYHCYVVIIDGGVPPGTHAVQDADYVCPPVLQRRDPDGGLHVVRTERVLPTKGLCCGSVDKYFNYRGDKIVLIATECLLQTTSMCVALCCKRFFCIFELILQSTY